MHLDESDGIESVTTAFDVGYRHLDCVQRYGNREIIGSALAESTVPRSELFIATKIAHPGVRTDISIEMLLEDARTSVEKLGVNAVDLLYIHWPGSYDLDLLMDAFDRIWDEGYFEHVGVCNFTPDLLDTVRDRWGERLAALQVELHPLFQQETLRGYCDRYDIDLVAYCPIIQGHVTSVPELRSIAERNDVTEAQVSLAWIRERGAIPIPKASSDTHICENWDSRSLELTTDDLARIDSIDREKRRVEPPHAPWL